MATVPPSIENSSLAERLAFVHQQWECMHHCELCGKCHMLHGRVAEDAYADYISGTRSYMEITLELRK